MSRGIQSIDRSERTSKATYWQQEAQRRTRKGPRKKVPPNNVGGNSNRRKNSKAKKKSNSRHKGFSKPAAIHPPWMKLRRICKMFEKLVDPRVQRTRKHRLVDIIVIAVCAVICGAQDWKGMARWARLHEDFLSQFLELPNGIPSRDTFRRVLCRLDPDKFQKCFLQWTSALRKPGKDRLFNIDGKTLRRSGRKKSDSPLHIVSVWAADRNLTLGQTTVEKKSNEITAIPKLLEILDIDGALITIDAMGCQKEIVRKIKLGKGDYCLAVKGNQEHLHQDLIDHFDKCIESDFEGLEHTFHHTSEHGHGRSETREYYMTKVPDTLRNHKAWTGLTAVGMTCSCREVNGSEQIEIRYFIVSISYRHIRRFAEAVRGHWSIENSLHWIMDVTFREDECRIQNEFGASNFSWLRRFAISLLKNEPTLKDSVKGKREEAMWNTDYLFKVLIVAVPDQSI